MTVLEILAILGIAVGVVALIVEMGNRGKAWGVYAALTVASASLLFTSMYASKSRERAALAMQLSRNAAVEEVKQVPEAESPVAETAEIAENSEDKQVAATEEEQPEEVDSEPEQDVDDSKIPPIDESAAIPAVANVPQEKAPRADAGLPIDDGKVNEKIRFSAARSKKHPKGADLKSFVWDFGDGETAKGKVVSHAFSKAGDYMVRLTVTDKSGAVGEATRLVSINRPAAKVRFVHQKPERPGAEPLTGTTTKEYSGSHLVLNSMGWVQAESGCTCRAAITIDGVSCHFTKDVVFSNGKSGDFSLHSTCKGKTGEYQWSVEHSESSHGCCTWVELKIDGYEG